MQRGQGDIRQGHTRATDTVAAVREFHDAVAQPDMALVLFFCSADHDLDRVAAEMARAFGDIPVAGCTSAGEIGPAGYVRGTIVGASFPSSRFTAAIGCLGSLGESAADEAQRLVQDLLRRLERMSPQASPANTFAFQMIDGLSMREEPVTRAFQAALGGIPLVGGSAGDRLDFTRTQVYCNGAFHPDSAVLVAVSTSQPFKPLITQHFVASERRVVVTSADTAQRIVREIDGRPAAETYAESIGADPKALDPTRFAAHPVSVRIGGMDYVRSISNVLPDGRLKFFCAIDEGMVLRIAHGADLVDDLERTFAALGREMDPVGIVIGCDCILRRLEIEQKGLTERVAKILRDNRVLGFNTYGEQYRGIHVNQTFTGIAIGGAGSPSPARPRVITTSEEPPNTHVR